MNKVLWAGTYDTVTGTAYAPGSGLWDLCYADDGYRLRIKNCVNVSTVVAPWEDTEAVVAFLKSLTQKVTRVSGSITFHELHNSSMCLDDSDPFSRVLNHTISESYTLGDSQRPYKPNQVCTFLLRPYENGDGFRAVILSLTRVYVESDDVLMILCQTKVKNNTLNRSAVKSFLRPNAQAEVVSSNGPTLTQECVSQLHRCCATARQK